MDGLLSRYSLAHAASNREPVAAMGGRALLRPEVSAADLGRPAGLFNAATLLQPLRPDHLDEVLSSVEAFYGGHGQGAALLWSAWPTPDLRPRGWKLREHPSLLARPPAPIVPAPPAPGFRIQEVGNARALSDWELVAIESFGFDELRPHRPGCLVDERVLAVAGMRLWVGYQENRPVCIGALFISNGLAYLQLGGTLPGVRQRGYWSAMVRQRLLAAPQLPAVSSFGQQSRPGAERLGFRPVTRLALWHRDR